MKRAMILGALAGLGALLPAQQVNYFHIFDETTEYTSRGLLTIAEGEFLNRVPGTHFGYLRVTTGMYYRVQDQNNATAETYDFIFRKADSTGAPDLTPSGVIYQEGPYTYSGTGAGATQAWYLTKFFAKPVLLPDGDFFYGIRLSLPGNGQGTWSTDGGSVHMSGAYPTAGGECGEHPRQGIDPHCGWNVIYASSAPSSAGEPQDKRSWAMKLLLPTAVLQPYAVDPIGGATSTPCPGKKDYKDLGFAGLWPDLVDLELYGYKARFGWWVREANARYGAAFVFISSQKIPAAMPTVFGNWYLLPSDKYFLVIGGFPATLSGWGEGNTTPLDPPDEARYALLGTYLYTQALVVDTTTWATSLSNWCGQSY